MRSRELSSQAEALEGSTDVCVPLALRSAPPSVSFLQWLGSVHVSPNLQQHCIKQETTPRLWLWLYREVSDHFLGRGQRVNVSPQLS